ncbi:RIP metalloprotease RseP [Chitinibacter bivalviorum]|uniref:Zinc metalloprotease n=1 Tax=Chitinibacter bivalviorum TaxID=2739434 RepID=A0A7H9BHY9_9NEIS|nr:RIP metalloprotease RseP [Chitinibacter bivalviorum]QLG87886.1 RIP metalloprotease RseP [Chitinibacter bivalviorum]
MLTFFSFLFAIALLVFVHEYGHYWVAKKCGVGVLTFSIGFGKPILQWKRGDTTWQIAMIPLGGFVRMMDENEAPVASNVQAKAFNRQHPLKKMAVVFAGPFANLLFAVLAFTACYLHGVDSIKAQVATVMPGSIAQQAGFKSGDQITQVGKNTIDTWDQLQVELFDYAGEPEVTIGVRDAHKQERQLVLSLSSLKAEQFDQRLLSRIGISPFASQRIVAFVQPQGAADLAGVKVGDEILAINQNPVHDWSDVQALVLKLGHKDLQLEIKRQQQNLMLTAKPKMQDSDGQLRPRLGLAPESDSAKNAQQAVKVKLGLLDALHMGVVKTYQMSVMTVRMFGKMLTGAISPKQVSGPLGIAEYAGQSASIGWLAYLQFLALISISLGVLNLLPVPILDGGHLLYHSYELVTGKTVSLLVTEWLQKIGLSLLLMLMALALFNDATRLLQG